MASYTTLPTLGVPGSGFASRGKGAHIKKLSFEPSGNEQHGSGLATPRTSRSHLLAGLRTAPKSAVYPPSAPPSQLHHGTENAMYTMQHGAKTSIGTNFGQQATYSTRPSEDAYSQQYAATPEVLAPPEIYIDEHGQESMDPGLYVQLVQTNRYLAEQQKQLQAQLASVTAATNQMKGMGLHQQVNYLQQHQYSATPPVTPQVYAQLQQQAMQPVVTQLAGAQPGYYQVYDPMTGQHTIMVDQAELQQSQYQQQFQQSQMSGYNNYPVASPPQQPGTPRFQVSPPTSGPMRSISPPKKSLSPLQNYSPLPPSSANAFRRGHNKSTSVAIAAEAGTEVDAGPRTSAPKTTANAPVAGQFGPGQARAGEHPVRQPRGPPSIEELKEKPTAKIEGSKNFATRTRRSAVHNLVRAGMDRGRAPGSGPGSAGSITPISETGDLTFSLPSDNDSDGGRSGPGSLSGRPSIGNQRISSHGAIGSDRPSSRASQKARMAEERNSVDSSFTTASVTSDEGAVGGSFAAVFKKSEGGRSAVDVPRKSMLVLGASSKKVAAVI